MNEPIPTGSEDTGPIESEAHPAEAGEDAEKAAEQAAQSIESIAPEWQDSAAESRLAEAALEDAALEDAGLENEFLSNEFAGEFAAVETPSEGAERVSKLIARAGLASRRAAEEIIIQGRVSINGHFVREPGAKADPARDRIVVDGRPLVFGEKTTTVILLHKPKYVVTTRDDQGKRTTVMDLLPHKFQQMHPVGRLDYETTGVLLLTDDGDLTNLLTHPSHGVEKVYEARVRGEVTREDIERLQNGLFLEDGKTAPCRARVIAQREKNALVELTLREGRTRQARRMFDAVGHPASALRRIRFAGIELEGLDVGAFRVLLPGEVKQLRKHAESALKEAKKRPKPPRKPFKGPPKGKIAGASGARPRPGAESQGGGFKSTAPRSSAAPSAGPRGETARGGAPRNVAPRSADSRSAPPRTGPAAAKPMAPRNGKPARPVTGNTLPRGAKPPTGPRSASGPRPPSGARPEGAAPKPRPAPKPKTAPKRERGSQDEQSPLAKRIDRKWR